MKNDKETKRQKNRKSKNQENSPPINETVSITDIKQQLNNIKIK